MRDIKRSFLGYNAHNVDEMIQSLKSELRYLQRENERQAQQIEDLTQELRKAKAEQELIGDAVIDAKHLSKRLVREAKEQATEMLFVAELDIKEQFAQFEQSMSTLKAMRDNIVQQKELLKNEIEEMIMRYRSALLDVVEKDTNVEQLSLTIDTQFEEIEEVMTATKQVIVLPKKLTREPKTYQLKQMESSDDIPLYSFE